MAAVSSGNGSKYPVSVGTASAQALLMCKRIFFKCAQHPVFSCGVQCESCDRHLAAGPEIVGSLPQQLSGLRYLKYVPT